MKSRDRLLKSPILNLFYSPSWRKNNLLRTDDEFHPSCRASPEEGIISRGPEISAKAASRIDKHTRISKVITMHVLEVLVY